MFCRLHEDSLRAPYETVRLMTSQILRGRLRCSCYDFGGRFGERDAEGAADVRGGIDTLQCRGLKMEAAQTDVAAAAAAAAAAVAAAAAAMAGPAFDGGWARGWVR